MDVKNLGCFYQICLFGKGKNRKVELHEKDYANGDSDTTKCSSVKDAMLQVVAGCTFADIDHKCICGKDKENHRSATCNICRTTPGTKCAAGCGRKTGADKHLCGVCIKDDCICPVCLVNTAGAGKAVCIDCDILYRATV
jgi:hypothetical protein